MTTITNAKCSNLINRVNEVLMRFQQILKAKTAHHLALRWMAFVALLGVFVVRTIFIVKGFHIIAYALGIVLLTQIGHFWSPLNDLLGGTPSSIPTAASSDDDISSEHGDDDNEQEPRHRWRRVTEYHVWFRSCRAVIVSMSLTYFSWFDVPVYSPILVGYLILLALFVLVQTMYRRYQAMSTTNIPSSSDNHLTTNYCTVQIHLIPRSDFAEANSFGITKILPWSATKLPPPFLKDISAAKWKTLLRDLEGVMVVDGKVRRQGLAFAAPILLCFMLSHYAFFALYEYFIKDILHCNNLHYQKLTTESSAAISSCYNNALGGSIIICFIPFGVYGLIAFRKLMAIQKKEIIFCAEKVKQICQEFQLKYPHSCFTHDVKLLRSAVVVEVSGLKKIHNPDELSYDRSDDNETVPNPNNDSMTDPLIVNV